MKMKGVINKIKCAKTFAALVVSGLALLLNAAEPTITADATSVTVNVPAGYATGARLILAYAGGDRGTQFAAWPMTRELASSIPAAGGSYSALLADLGFPDGNCAVRAFFESGFQKLDYLVVDAANDYLDPGMLDTEVYGLEFGYTPKGGGQYGKIICALTVAGGTGTSFRYEGKQTSFDFCADDTGGKKSVTKTTLNTGSKNTVEVRNSALTVNGVKYPCAYRTAPIGLMGSHIRLNTKDPDTSDDHNYGWWYYLRIYGADDRLLVDYIPVRRTVDGTVGFYDQAEQRFVTPTGGGTYGAGTAVTDGAFTNICAVTPVVDVTSRRIALSVAGNVATVTVPAGVATGEKLYLVSDETDRGLDVLAWNRAAVLSEAIPEEGGSFTCTLTGFSTYPANVLRAFTTEDYTRLASLTANEASDYLDTGVTDTLCYGLEYGYQPIDGAGKYGKTFAATAGTVRFERAYGGDDPRYTFCFYNEKYEAGKIKLTFTLDENACNTIVFRNKTLTLNGSIKATAASAPIGKSDGMLRMNNKGLDAVDRDCGKWYYLRLFGRSGCKLVDYVPARSANGTVGFVDFASRTFVTPTGGGTYTTSDNVGQGTISRIIRMTAPLDYEDLSIPVTAEWIGGEATDLTESTNWRCRNGKGGVLVGVLPDRSVTDVTVSGTFAFSVPTAEDVCWRSLKFENASLSGDADWRGSFGGDLADGFTLDLNGHTLTVDDLQGSGTITDTSASGGVLRLDVPANAKAVNAGVLLTGSLKLLKTGAGEYRSTASGAEYTGGTVIGEGYCSMPSRAHPSGNEASITINTNGVFDINCGTSGDDCAWNGCTMILAGGTLENLGSDVNEGWKNLKTVRLAADSRIYAYKIFGFIGAGYGETELDLGGHTLELDASRNGFYFFNTTIRNGYVDITNGGWIVCNGNDGAVVDASTSSIEFHENPRWDVRKDLLVSNLVMRAIDEGDTAKGSAKIKISGRFTPYTDYIHNYELQDGSTLDLSQHPAVYPTVNPKKSQYKVTCAADARKVTVDLGGRKVSSNQKILSWPSGQIPSNATSFKPVAGAPYGFDVRDDGLYVIQGFTVIVL